MKRLTILLMAMAAALVMTGGGAALAEPSGQTSGMTPNETQDDAALLENSMNEGGPQGTSVTEQAVSTASTGAQPDWLYGPASHSYYDDWFTGMITPYTMEWVAYWGTEDVSYPRVGDLYYGRIVIGNVTNFEAWPVVDIILPPNTNFDINSTDPNRKIRCYLWDYQADPNGEALQELTGDSCPREPSQGFYGWNFNPENTWRLDPGKALIVDFPVRSSATLSGIAGPDCLIGTVMVGGYDDVPEPGDTCPLEDNDGAYQGVFVSEAPDTTAPKVASAAPTGTGIKRDTSLAATFSEKMNKDTITKSTFKLFKVTATGTTQVTNVTVRLSLNGLKATLDPFGASATLLAKNTKYKAVVTTGAKDLAGNRLDQNSSKEGNQQKAWTFTTGTS